MHLHPDILKNNMEICRFIGGVVRDSWRVMDTINYVWEGDRVNEFRLISHMPAVHKDPVILMEHTRFHNDWNWLMKAVEKIESIIDKNGRPIEVIIDGTNISIRYGGEPVPYEDYWNDVIFSTSANGPTKIDSIYGLISVFCTEWNSTEGFTNLQPKEEELEEEL